MARADRLEWSPEFTRHTGVWPGRLHRGGADTLTFHAERPFAQLQPGDNKKLDNLKEELLDLNKRPASGRTTALGRKVEKPGPVKGAGPSGQTDGVQHERNHANK